VWCERCAEAKRGGLAEHAAAGDRLRFHGGDGSGNFKAGQVRFGHGQVFTSQAVSLPGKITAVYDGDTCTADVDLGFKVVVRGEKIRLARINAPEIRGASRKEGLVAWDFLRELILGKEVLLKTIRDKRGKYGRYLGEIIVEKGRRNVNANNALVKAGHAKYVEY
jgi:micrococcal nuclease